MLKHFELFRTYKNALNETYTDIGYEDITMESLKQSLIERTSRERGELNSFTVLIGDVEIKGYKSEDADTWTIDTWVEAGIDYYRISSYFGLLENYLAQLSHIVTG